MFKEYAFSAHDGALRKSFSASLSSLVDSLAVCAGSDGAADLALKWPDQDGRLLLQCVARVRARRQRLAERPRGARRRRLNAVRETDDMGGTVDSCIYAEISCEASNFAEDLEGEMTRPRSTFSLPVRAARALACT